MAFRIGQIVKGRVEAIKVNEEGLSESFVIAVNEKDTVIIPISEIDLITNNTEEDLKSRRLARRFIGKIMIAKIINTNPIIGSNKQALLEQKMSVNLNEGQEIEGIVVAVDSNEAKIEYKDCVIATLPSDEYNHLKTVNLRFVLNIGDTIKAKVLSVDEEREEVIITHKPYADDTWDELLEKYQIGSQHLGRIINMIKHGVFVNLAPGIDILCTPYPFFEVNRGDEVAVEITSVDEKAGRIRGIVTAKAITA